MHREEIVLERCRARLSVQQLSNAEIVMVKDDIKQRFAGSVSICITYVPFFHNLSRFSEVQHIKPIVFCVAVVPGYI